MVNQQDPLGDEIDGLIAEKRKRKKESENKNKGNSKGFYMWIGLAMVLSILLGLLSSLF